MNLHSVPVATILVVIFAVVGGIVVLLNDHNLSLFKVYIAAVLGGAGLLGIGRGHDPDSRP